MIERAFDIIITIGILLFLLIKYKNRTNWFFLIFAWIFLNAVFNALVVCRDIGICDISVITLNAFSRSIKWFGISSCLYYAIKGEK